MSNFDLGLMLKFLNLQYSGRHLACKVFDSLFNMTWILRKLLVLYDTKLYRLIHSDEYVTGVAI